MLNDNENIVVGTFAKNLDEYENEIMILIWNGNSKVVAEFDTCFEDANDFDLDEDDEFFEEYTSFAFKKKELFGEPPIEVTEDGFFLVNYHNFPNEILVNGKKIN